MALTEKQKQEVSEYAKQFVEGHVKCNTPDSRFDVSGNTCDLVKDAVEKSMARCNRPAVAPADAEECDRLLKKELEEAITSLNCP